MAADEDLIVPVEIGPYEAGDETAILSTFQRVFGCQRSLAEWEWEFRQNPAGLHCFRAKTADGRVVSQFTGIPRRVQVGSEERCFAEIVDSMTDPEFRQGLKKPGLFASTCLQYVEHFGRPDREAIMYGLPVPQAWRIGARLLGYRLLHDVELLEGDVSAEPTVPPAGERHGLSYRTVNELPSDLEELSQAVRAHHDVIVIRDRRYLTWRFLLRPNVSYRIVEVRDVRARLLALVVLRHGWLGQPLTALAEWIVRPDEPALSEIIDLVKCLARSAGSEALRLFLRPGWKEWQAFRDRGCEPIWTEWRFVARTYEPDRLSIDRLRDGWYVTLGDFDLA